MKKIDPPVSRIIEATAAITEICEVPDGPRSYARIKQLTREIYLCAMAVDVALGLARKDVDRIIKMIEGCDES